MAHCDHKWRQIGLWDGGDKDGNKVDKNGWIGGPSARCLHCGEEKYFRWNEWKALPKEKKIGLKG